MLHLLPRRRAVVENKMSEEDEIVRLADEIRELLLEKNAPAVPENPAGTVPDAVPAALD